ncbi:hypothetical protein [Microbacterium sp.]|uniref:hypothetical protein n=1 Tax=Microbacterium sp. TaxID=51671 RepID=UPI00261D3E59|nr:hypothetical protein [Microbacterium sp.]
MSNPQGMRPSGDENPPHDDADAEGAATEETQPVPAGRAGADSGAVDAVSVDPDDEAEIPDSSAMNDEPGVGPGRPRP